MSIDWTPLSSLIETYDRFVVTSHVRPDGDALGSEVGMVGLLRQKGKDVRAVNVSRTPPRYDFLDHDGTLFEHFGTAVTPGDLADRQVLVILDLSSWSQLGEMADWVRAFPGPRVVIDHHVSQDDLGATYLKDTSAEATGTLVVRAAHALKAEITPEMATGLITAIAMDTGWFHHPNTHPSTLRTAAELVEAGAEIDAIYRLLFERNTLGRLRMMGETLSGLRTDMGGRIAYAAVTRDDFERTGAIPPDTEDLVDFTVSIRGVEVGLLFIEQMRGGIKMSIRSRTGLDCAKLVSAFGGGGHKAAAGATLPDPLSEAVPRVLAAVRAALGG
ncbi:MAG TPA: bifunctional oligoribonuclease/PAP phosphatase NrnA [Isosphaeraceae bacterium]|jgi:phosphoesterase RecJ-like protein